MNNSKSQIGQDKILGQEIFRGKTNGVFVEVGALDVMVHQIHGFLKKKEIGQVL